MNLRTTPAPHAVSPADFTARAFEALTAATNDTHWHALLWTAAYHPHEAEPVNLALISYQAPYEITDTHAGWISQGRIPRPTALGHSIYATRRNAPRHSPNPRAEVTEVYSKNQTGRIASTDPEPRPQLPHDPAYDDAVRDATRIRLRARGYNPRPDNSPSALLGILGYAVYRQKFGAGDPDARIEGESAAHLAALILRVETDDSDHPVTAPDSHTYAQTLATIQRVVHTGRTLADSIHSAMHLP